MKTPVPTSLEAAKCLGRAVREVTKSSALEISWSDAVMSSRWVRGEIELFVTTRWNDDVYFTTENKRAILILFTTYQLER